MAESATPSNLLARFGEILLILLLASAIAAWAVWVNLETPYLAFSMAAAFLFHVRSKPPLKELALALGIGAVLAGIRLAVVPRNPHDYAGFVAAMAGLGSFLVLGVRAIRSSGIERKRLFVLLGPALGLVFFIFSAQRALNLADLLYPKTFDLYLYTFDGSLGFEPSFLMGQLFHHSVVIREIGLLAYATLPLVMALVYAGWIDPHATKPAWYILELFFLAGFLGWAFYNFVPGTGPAYAFAGLFPERGLSYNLLHRLLLERVPVSANFPRNAIPSLHMGWVLLLWWSCRRFSRWARAAAFLYLLITVMATLGTGEHYFIDLVVAAPFALMVEALCQSALPFRRRLAPLLTGLLMTVAWLSLIRFGTPLMLHSRLIPWGLIVISTVAAFFVEHRTLGLHTVEASAADSGALAAAASV
ncbi:MAG TPA: phosphatase PAP2 family protein [Terriglobales bacterium]|nr:phosphatase PAP2 family protein [Terriglobales bacterium]